MATHKKNTLLKAAKSYATTKAFKRVFFSPPKNPPFLFFQIYFSQSTGYVRNRTDIAFNVNSFGQSVCRFVSSLLRTDRRASGNSGFKKLAVQWLNEHLFFVSSVVLTDSFVLQNRQLLKPTKRYR